MFVRCTEYLCMCMYIYIYIYIYIHTYTHTHTHTNYVCKVYRILMFVYVYMYIYIYTHTHTHTNYVCKVCRILMRPMRKVERYSEILLSLCTSTLFIARMLLFRVMYVCGSYTDSCTANLIWVSEGSRHQYCHCAEFSPLFV